MASEVIDVALGHNCEECGERVLRCGNGVYLDPTPASGGPLCMYVMPLPGMSIAVGGRPPDGVKQFEVHDHQPPEAA